MALKAGRVGVAPDQVDEFGNISSSATSGYTKQEADAKFETQLHAFSTYETKIEAAALQPKTLAVPIEMLDGSKLTVESALQGLNTQKADKISSNTAMGDIVTGASVDSTAMGNNIYKEDNTVMVCLTLNDVTVDANTDIGVIPEGYRPKQDIVAVVDNKAYRFKNNGSFQCVTSLTAQRMNIFIVYVV